MLTRKGRTHCPLAVGSAFRPGQRSVTAADDDDSPWASCRVRRLGDIKGLKVLLADTPVVNNGGAHYPIRIGSVGIGKLNAIIFPDQRAPWPVALDNLILVNEELAIGTHGGVANLAMTDGSVENTRRWNPQTMKAKFYRQ